MEKELGNQVTITTEFGREIPKQIGDYAQAKEIELLAQGNIEEAKKWAEGGVYRVALHTAMGALATGTAEGAFTAGAAASAAPKLNHLQAKLKQKLNEQGLESDVAEMISQSVLNLTLAGVGASAGLDTGSTVYALNTDVNNRQLHPPEKNLAKVLFEKAKKQGLKTADGANYTLQDIEDALRWANSGMYGETYNNNRAVRIGNKASQSAIDKVMYDNGVGRNYDARLWLSSKNGNVTTFTQNLSGIKKPDTNLTGFI